MLEIALAGCPSSGKSTFFKAATLKDVKIAPYPFTTTSSAEGIAHVRTNCVCGDFKLKCAKCINGIRFVPIKLWDIPGLVQDAHKGRGRGIAFLDDIRQSSGLIHVVDVSGTTDLEGNPAEGFDPSTAIEMLDNEFNWWLFNIFKKSSLMGADKSFIKEMAKRFSGLSVKESDIDLALKKSNLNAENYKSWNDESILKFADNLRRIAKPSAIAANKFDLPKSEKNFEKLKQNHPDKLIIPTSADLELALREAAKAGIIEYLPGDNNFKIINESALNGKQKSALNYIKVFLEKWQGTGVQEVINRAAFELLDMIVVYPVADPSKMTDKTGNILPDAHLLKRGSTALDLAYKIHEDIGKKFIGAVDARTGKYVSADYQLKNNDVISIRAGR